MSASRGLVLWARMNTVLDFRRLMDYMFTEYNVDEDRVCYGGASKGGIMGTILGAVDSRVKQSVIRAAGADIVMWMEESQDPRMVAVREASWYTPEFYGTLMAPYDAQYFVPELSPRPVLFQFGRQDSVFPQSTFEKMIALAGDPKDVIWYDAGHGLAAKRVEAAEDVRTWLAQQVEHTRTRASTSGT